MNTCVVCSQQRTGRLYTFHYGRKLPTGGNAHVLGEGHAFVCNDCVRRKQRAEPHLWITGMLIFWAGISVQWITSFHYGKMINTWLIWTIPLCFGPGFFLVILGLWVKLSAQARVGLGEEMAIKARRGELEIKENANQFWDSADFAKLRRQEKILVDK